jgi:oligopeptide/dipeptide ABC transporter ATP-binding protein
MTAAARVLTRAEPVLVAEHVHKWYGRPGASGSVHAVRDVSLVLRRGRALGVVGESGSGKSTLGRCLLGLIETTSGTVRLDDTEITGLNRRALRKLRGDMQIVYQEPKDSFDPRLPIIDQITEPVRAAGLPRAKATALGLELLVRVGLNPDIARYRPRMLSGGMLQRCAVARALAPDPHVIVLDEPTSALPPRTAADLTALFSTLRAELGLTLLVLSHDMDLVRALCDELIVMYAGQVVERGTAAAVLATAGHPYARALLSASLLSPLGEGTGLLSDGDPLLAETAGGQPAAALGCALSGRCPYGAPRCAREPQPLAAVAADRDVRCWRVGEGSYTGPADWRSRESYVAGLAPERLASAADPASGGV